MAQLIRGGLQGPTTAQNTQTNLQNMGSSMARMQAFGRQRQDERGMRQEAALPAYEKALALYGGDEGLMAREKADSLYQYYNTLYGPRRAAEMVAKKATDPLSVEGRRAATNLGILTGDLGGIDSDMQSLIESARLSGDMDTLKAYADEQNTAMETARAAWTDTETAFNENPYMDKIGMANLYADSYDPETQKYEQATSYTPETRALKNAMDRRDWETWGTPREATQGPSIEDAPMYQSDVPFGGAMPSIVDPNSMEGRMLAGEEARMRAEREAEFLELQAGRRSALNPANNMASQIVGAGGLSPQDQLANYEQVSGDTHYPAMISPQETVINPVASKVFAPELDAMNKAAPNPYAHLAPDSIPMGEQAVQANQQAGLPTMADGSKSDTNVQNTPAVDPMKEEETRIGHILKMQDMAQKTQDPQVLQMIMGNLSKLGWQPPAPQPQPQINMQGQPQMSMGGAPVMAGGGMPVYAPGTEQSPRLTVEEWEALKAQRIAEIQQAQQLRASQEAQQRARIQAAEQARNRFQVQNPERSEGLARNGNVMAGGGRMPVYAPGDVGSGTLYATPYEEQIANEKNAVEASGEAYRNMDGNAWQRMWNTTPQDKADREATRVANEAARAGVVPADMEANVAAMETENAIDNTYVPGVTQGTSDDDFYQGAYPDDLQIVSTSDLLADPEKWDIWGEKTPRDFYDRVTATGGTLVTPRTTTDDKAVPVTTDPVKEGEEEEEKFGEEESSNQERGQHAVAAAKSNRWLSRDRRNFGSESNKNITEKYANMFYPDGVTLEDFASTTDKSIEAKQDRARIIEAKRQFDENLALGWAKQDLDEVTQQALAAAKSASLTWSKANPERWAMAKTNDKRQWDMYTDALTQAKGDATKALEIMADNFAADPALQDLFNNTNLTLAEAMGDPTAQVWLSAEGKDPKWAVQAWWNMRNAFNAEFDMDEALAAYKAKNAGPVTRTTIGLGGNSGEEDYASFSSNLW